MCIVHREIIIIIYYMFAASVIPTFRYLSVPIRKLCPAVVTTSTPLSSGQNRPFREIIVLYNPTGTYSGGKSLVQFVASGPLVDLVKIGSIEVKSG